MGIDNSQANRLNALDFHLRHDPLHRSIMDLVERSEQAISAAESTMERLRSLRKPSVEDHRLARLEAENARLRTALAEALGAERCSPPAIPEVDFQDGPSGRHRSSADSPGPSAVR